MALSRGSFLGASIVNFSASLGWGSQPSSLNVTLVEDNANGDSFNPPINQFRESLGAPVYFEYEGWTFGGLLQNWKRKHGTSGNPLYDIVITDPREILDGVQMILDGYTGSTYNVPNIYNVYGFLESNYGFGQAGVNEGGMPWRNVLLAMNAIANSSLDPVVFKGSTYVIDLSALPSVPSFYRIGGANISLMDYINEICEAGVHDYFFILQEEEVYNTVLDIFETRNVIKLQTISRNDAPQLGKIDEYVVNNTETVVKDSGRELRNETTSKFAVGGNKLLTWFQYAGSNQAIWPFWGLNAAQNPVYGVGVNDAHTFAVDSRTLNVPGIGAFYWSDVAEMRAALAGQESWEIFLSGRDDNKDTPQFKRATKLNIIGNGLEKLKTALEAKALAEIKAMSPIEFGGFSRKQINSAIAGGHEETIRIIYDFVYKLASEFYGKQFLVSIPFLYTAQDDETGLITTSYETTDAGYIDENEFASAVSLNLMPFDVNSVTTQDGRVEAYVKYDNAQNLDFSDVPENDLIMQPNGTTVFVKCQVNPEIVHLNRSTNFSPKAIVTISGQVRDLDDSNDFAGAMLAVLREVLTTHGDAKVEETIAKLIGQPGGEQLFFENRGAAVIPTMAAVPLKSNIDVYGPWYLWGAEGKVEFEQDESLVPWNYGGFSAMNLAGNAKVVGASSNAQVGETGLLEFPGAPTIQLGGQLISAGPYVTDITIKIGADGVTSTYRMETWTRRFGKISKANADRMQRISKRQQQQRRMFRNLFKQPAPPFSKFFALRERAGINRKKPASSSQVIMGMMLTNTDTDARKGTAAIAPNYNVSSHMGVDYEKKAAMSLDGMFRPYTVDASGDSNILPHFEVGTSGTINAQVLSPFGSGHDISLVTHGSGIPDTLLSNGSADGTEEVRAMGVKMPLIAVGWGYDKDGKPVPNSDPDTPTDDFLDDHRSRMDKWKAGPVDLRWDNDRKVWDASGGTDLIVLQPSSHINPGESGNAVKYTYNEVNGNMEVSSTTYFMHDVLNKNYVLDNEQVLCSKLTNNTYSPVGENGLTRLVDIGSNDMNVESSGLATLTFNGAVSLYYYWEHMVEVTTPIPSSGQSLQGVVQYNPSDSRWHLLSVSCYTID